MVDNPDYKGEWSPKRIDNPAYKGEWKPKQIKNKDYEEGVQLAAYEGAMLGFELWIVNNGTIFDNILVTDDIEYAKAQGEKLWKPTQEGEKEVKEKWDKENKPDEPEGGEEDGEDFDEVLARLAPPPLAARSTASPARPLPCPPHGFWLTPAPLAPGRGAARGGGGGEGRAVGRDATLRLRGGSTLALARRPPPCGRPAGNAERSSSAPARGAFGRASEEYCRDGVPSLFE